MDSVSPNIKKCINVAANKSTDNRISKIRALQVDDEYQTELHSSSYPEQLCFCTMEVPCHFIPSPLEPCKISFHPCRIPVSHYPVQVSTTNTCMPHSQSTPDLTLQWFLTPVGSHQRENDKTANQDFHDLVQLWSLLTNPQHNPALNFLHIPTLSPCKKFLSLPLTVYMLVKPTYG